MVSTPRCMKLGLVGDMVHKIQWGVLVVVVGSLVERKSWHVIGMLKFNSFINVMANQLSTCKQRKDSFVGLREEVVH